MMIVVKHHVFALRRDAVCDIYCVVRSADSPLSPLKSSSATLEELVQSMAAAKRMTPAQLVRESPTT